MEMGYIQVTKISKGFIAIRLVIYLRLKDLSNPSSLFPPPTPQLENWGVGGNQKRGDESLMMLLYPQTLMRPDKKPSFYL